MRARIAMIGFHQPNLMRGEVDSEVIQQSHFITKTGPVQTIGIGQTGHRVLRGQRLQQFNRAGVESLGPGSKLINELGSADREIQFDA